MIKCRVHHPSAHPFARHCEYTCSRVRWSDSGTKNFSRAASDSSCRSLGRYHTLGTDSIDTIVSISSLHAYSSPAAVISSFASGGSIGNALIRRPSPVSSPRLSTAPSAHRSNSDVVIVSCGGGSMKSKSSRSLTPSDFSSSTVFARFVRWISGIVWMYSSFLNAASVYRWNALPGPVRPARPARCELFACEIGVTCSVSMPMRGLYTLSFE
ncbi:hypothetical protein KEM52_005645 [Ascosphaera acerosa]|nr:hypothetical protein KEM52_005645 [Ascosphaera acerosa]